MNNVLCFSLTGKIIFGCIYFLGLWHDAHVSAALITKVVDNIGDYKVCVDQGAAMMGRCHRHRSLQKYPPFLVHTMVDEVLDT
jgi:hypothetical protein